MARVDAEELRIFLEELEENLNYLDNAIIALEENPQNRDILQEIFRSAHTLKGNAGFLDLKNLVSLGHTMEDVFQKLQKGETPITPRVIDILLECKDTIAAIGLALREGRDPNAIDVEPLVEKVRSILEDQEPSLSLNKVELSKTTPVKLIPGTKLVRVWISPHEPAPAIRAYLVQTKISQLGEIVSFYPSEEERELPEFASSERELGFYVKTNLSKEEIPEKINIDLIERVEVIAEETKDEIADKEKSRKKDVAEIISDETASDTVRIPVSRLDTLLNLVGELVIANSGLLQIYELVKENKSFSEIEKLLRDRTKEIFRISSEIQELVMKSRLVPIGGLFSRFKRFVRDYSNRTNKKIQLLLSGEDTEIDKKITDEMIKPLTHLVRNALDHGIEDVAERKEKGKREVGLLRLSAFQEGNYINVIVEDDGRGLDYQKIVRKAVQKGLITKEQALTISEEQAKMLIFQSGFSTKDSVDDISGRGIGMDIVKRSVELLNGSLDIQTKKDEGTKVIIKLPLTLAIINALIVEISGEKFSIPMTSIVETHRIGPENILLIEGSEMVRLRDSLLPLIRLNKIFNLPPSPQKATYPVIVVEYNDSLVGLLVDDFLNRQEMVIKSLAENYRPVEGISGASILGDGSIILILDVHGIIQLYKREVSLFLGTDKNVKVSFLQKETDSESKEMEKKEELVQAQPLVDLSDLEIKEHAALSLQPKEDREKALRKLQELFLPERRDLLKEWLRQGNMRAIEGIRALTGNRDIRLDKSKGKHLAIQKLETMLQKIETANLDVVDFMLPIEPVDGAVHFILTRKNAEKMVKKLLEEANLPLPEEITYEPLLEVTNILGASYTNSLTAVTEVVVEPGIPVILEEKDEILHSIREKITKTVFEVLYVENEFVWEEEDILAELLILIPEIKI